MKISGKELLQKAMQVLDDSLEGRPVDPNALTTAIQMTQYVWIGWYFTNPIEFTNPIKCRGLQGFGTPKPEIIEQIFEQIEKQPA